MNDEAEGRSIYRDSVTGVSITTNSMLKTFRRCPRQAMYKYEERLKPKILGRPLRRGTWLHALLEAYYKGEDWELEHKKQTMAFNKLYEEERDAMGDLPDECSRIFKSYLWHYKSDDWKVHEVEFTLETPFPDGTIYRGRIDLLVEDQYGLWIVDHKSHKTLPNLDYRISDSQSALYIWAAKRMGIPVQGHIWNYIRTKAPSKPPLTQAGRLSRALCDTDYPTWVTSLKSYGMDPFDQFNGGTSARLKSQQYRHGELQTSGFFRRDVLEKSNAMLKQVATEAYMTSKRMHAYPFNDPRKVERVPERGCIFACSYTTLCQTELIGGNADQVRRTKYTIGDPMDYYNDNESVTDRKDDADG